LSVLLIGGLLLASPPARSMDLPDAVKDAPPNTWVALNETKTSRRESPIFAYAPTIGRFVRAGGGLHYKKSHFYYRYDTEHFDPTKLTWTNAYPEGRGEGRPESGRIEPKGWNLKQTGRYALLHKDGDALRLSNRWMFEQWSWAGDAEKLYVYFGQMATYDPKTRRWATVEQNGKGGEARWCSLCYDPVNGELLKVGGDRRLEPRTYVFALKTNTWRRLELGSGALKTLRDKAQELRRRAIELLGRAANRFSIAETEAEAKVDLTERATELAAELKRLAAEAKAANVKPHETAAAAHVASLLAQTAADCNAVAEELGGKIDAALISEVRAVRVAVDRAFHALMAEPSPRGLTRPVYDPVHQKIVLFGGDSHDRVHSDTWVYDCKTRTWEQRFPELAPPPRAGHILRWLPDAKKVVLAGGYSRRRLAQDIWTYDVGENEWTLHKVVPLERHRHNRWWSPGTPRARGNGYPLVGDVAPGDVLFALPPRSSAVWACRIDVSKTDAKNQAKLAVEPGTFTFHGIDPAAWEKAANPDRERMKKFFDELPKNQWTAIPFAKRPPVARNIWGTTAYDRDRHQFLFWGGGHATSKMNAVCHFSIRGGCWTLAYWPDEPLNPGSYMSWGGPTFQDRPAMPWAHAYQAYEYDPSGRMLLLGRAYDVRARAWLPEPVEGLKHAGLMHSMVEWTPHGVVCYSKKRRGPVLGLYRYEAKSGAFKKQPWKGPTLARVWCDGTAMCYDRTRDCLWLSNGHVIRYDFKTGEARQVETTPAKMTLDREAVHIPGADLILQGGHRATAAWDPKTGDFLRLDLPWVVDAKKVEVPNLHWHAGIAYDPQFEAVLINDLRNRRVWALRFDRDAAKLTEIGSASHDSE
ncbi:MAG: kelch repeat-containing protein, partial [Planctomycetota bacterium]